MVLKFNLAINDIVPSEKMDIFIEVIKLIQDFSQNNNLEINYEENN